MVIKMKTERKSISSLILQIALGLMFLVSGIWSLQRGNGDEIAIAIRSIFDGDIENVVVIAFAIIEIITGVFLLLRIFVFLGTNLDKVFMLIILICWIACIVMTDFIGPNGIMNYLNSNFLSFVNRFANHLLILGAIIKVSE